MRLNGPAIVELREARRMSQLDLARAAGINPSALCQYETGKRGKAVHPSVGGKIADALAVELEAIRLPADAELEPDPQDPAEAA
jgi:transcriptional regulator with XRE-family HTH domain